MATPAAEQDPRVYFAAERTFLAWIRTGLGLMGVGFAVARFGLFLREMGAAAAHVTSHTMGLSVLSGVALVGIGVAVNINAIVRHVIVVREFAPRVGFLGKSQRALWPWLGYSRS